MFSFSEFFLEYSFNVFAYFMMGDLRAHTAMSVQQFLTKNGMTPVPYPLYLPDLALSDIFLFPPMKKFLKGKCFANVGEVKQKTAESLKAIKVDKFKNCFEQWKNISTGALHQMESTLKVTEI